MSELALDVYEKVVHTVADRYEDSEVGFDKSKPTFISDFLNRAVQNVDVELRIEDMKVRHRDEMIKMNKIIAEKTLIEELLVTILTNPDESAVLKSKIRKRMKLCGLSMVMRGKNFKIKSKVPDQPLHPAC